jgi:sugar (pentulose or hexulose) kinase
VALNIRWAWSCASKLVPRGAQPLRLLGGAAQSQVWPQIMADMLEHPVAVMEHGTWGGSHGAAMTAAVAAQWHGSLPEAMESARILRTYEPRAQVAGWAQSRYDGLLAFHKATRNWHHRQRGAGDSH